MPMRMAIVRAAAGLLVASTVGCSGDRSPVSIDGASDGAAPVEIRACGDLSEPFTPRRDGLCSMPDRVCSCYDDHRAECQTRLLCEGGHWTEQRASCPPPPATDCPDSVEHAKGQPCAPRLADCNYPGQGRCFCAAPSDPWGWVPEICAGPSTPTWFCGYPNEGCPLGIPDIGAPCPREGVRCGDACVRALGGPPFDRQCIDGAWQPAVRDSECL